MRVRLSANPPLPPVKAWFPVTLSSTPTVSSFKSLLSTSLPAFRGLSLRLSIDGFELLDNSELSIVRDGDLICVDVLDMTSGNGASVILGRDAAANAPPALDQAFWGAVVPATSHKRKRRMSTPSSSSSKSETESTSSSPSSSSESESDSDTSVSQSASDSDDSIPTTPSLRKAQPARIDARERAKVTPSLQPKPRVIPPATFVPPGYGKPQTRSRNLRRRQKRTHEREAAGTSEGGPVSGSNAVDQGPAAWHGERARPLATSYDANPVLTLPSLSLRNKNKAKNFKSLMGKPLPPKIIFADQEGDASVSISASTATPECITPAGGLSKSQTPAAADRQAFTQHRLIPPSSRSSLPSNIFVTSIDVEAGLHRTKKKRRMHIEYGDNFEGHTEDASAEVGDNLLDYGDAADAGNMAAPKPASQECERDMVMLESIADQHWAMLERLTGEQQVVPGIVVGYKALGINPATYTPEYLLTLGRVRSFDAAKTMVIRPLRPREQVSFSGPVEPVEGEEGGGAEEEEHAWHDVVSGDWRVVERG